MRLVSTSGVVLEARGVRKAFDIPAEQRHSLREIVGARFRRVQTTRLVALDDISFDIRRGEFVGIVGDNGCGKTTLLRVLAGIYPADRGHVAAAGSIAPLLELGTGFNGELSARDNILINGCILGIPLPELRQRWREILSFAGLARFADMKIKNFSSGMVSRLAFAIASFVDADAYLMDEVFAVGDIEFKRLCLARLEELKGSNRTIVLVTHDLASVREHCSRGIILERGRIVFDGDAAECVERYAASHQTPTTAEVAVTVE
jgi:ABC-type polysaccharide/polyol phosphate transport system ATPase subunit